MEDTTKIVLPAIAVRGIVPLPGNEFRIEVGRANSVQALEASEKMYGGNILLLVQKDSTAKDVTKDDLEKIGVLARFNGKTRLPSNNYRVKFKVANRVEIKEFTSEDPYFVCNCNHNDLCNPELLLCFNPAVSDRKAYNHNKCTEQVFN